MLPFLKRLFNRIHVWLYRATGGRFGARLLGMDILLLSTRGRRSGRPRTTPLAYFREPDGVFVVGADAGAPRHPGWYHNLCDDPRCEVIIGGSTVAATARVLQGAERQQRYDLFRARAGDFASQYEAKTARPFPVVFFPL